MENGIIRDMKGDASFSGWPGRTGFAFAKVSAFAEATADALCAMAVRPVDKAAGERASPGSLVLNEVVR